MTIVDISKQGTRRSAYRSRIDKFRAKMGIGQRKWKDDDTGKTRFVSPSKPSLSQFSKKPPTLTLRRDKPKGI